MRLVLLAAVLTLISAAEWEDASQYVKPVVDFAEKSFNARMNSIFIHKITQVTKALRKAEDGWKYDMEFVMAPTDCMKFGEQHQDCHVAENSPKQTCQVDISLTSAGHFSLDDFNCKSMNKRLAGGIGAPVDNPEDMKYKDLLRNATSSINSVYTINRVVSVRTQVVAGIKYYIDFYAANAAGKEELCEAILVEQVWLNALHVLNYRCDGKELAGRSKRLVGGIGAPVVNPEDDKYRNLLTRATSFTNTLYKVNKVISVRKQVVSGYKYYIDFSAANAAGKEELCTAVLWEQPWRGSLNVLNYRCDGKDYTPKNKRLAGGIGAPVDNPEDMKYKDLLRNATSSINSVYTINRVVSVRTQVVAGIKYYIDFYAANAAGKEELCEAILVEQVWLNALHVLNYRCDGKELAGRNKRLAGGIGAPVDNPEDMKYKDLLRTATSSINSVYTINRVVSVRTQVVAGIKYYIDFYAANAAGKEELCEAILVEQVWLNALHVLNYRCDGKELAGRNKRLVGGIGAPVDNPEDDEYRNLLTRATSLTNTLYKVNKVISVRTQVVAGIKYYIDFSAANAAGKEELCTAVIWEQSWTNLFDVQEYRCNGKDYTLKNRRLAGGIGAPVDNPEDTKYKDLLRTATSSINSVYTINRVVSVRTQVVAGIKYYIDFYAANAAGKEELCKAVLWEQSWLGSLNVLNYRCDGKELAGSGKRSLAGGLVGGISSVDTSRFGEFKVKAQKAVESENADIKNIRVIDVKQQVVSGINTFMVIQGESSSGQTTTCDVRLYERSWDNVFNVQSIKCT